MTAEIKLNDPIPDFKYFAEDQILTADDLNRVVDFLDRQQRMTRVYGLGVGIVCGLAPNRLPGGTIEVGKGVALTTDGDMLVMADNTTYTHFTEFRDAEAKYGALRRANGQLVRMWEMTNEPGPERFALSQFSQRNGLDFSEVLVVFYLESYRDPEQDCDDAGCDKRGDRQKRIPRMLLVRKVDIEPSLDRPAAALPVPVSTRVNLQHNRISSYRSANGLAARYARAVNATRSSLLDAINQLNATPFKSMLDSVIGNRSDWQSQLNQNRFKPGNNSARIQYVYTCLRDLVEAFNDWRSCACRLDIDHLPDPQEFAKHVVLGEPLRLAAAATLTRQRFRPSALIKDNGETLARCHVLLQRLDVMLRSFNNSQINDLRITPSRSCRHTLGERAMPYYFQPDGLRDVWSYIAQAEKRQTHLYSYHANEDAQASNVAKDPFAFDVAAVDFVRIEGHMGKQVEDVEKQLDALAATYNLPFRVVAIAVDDDVEKVRIPPRLRFPDLDAIFRLHKINVLTTVREARDFGRYAKSKVAEVQPDNLAKVQFSKTQATKHIDDFNLEVAKTVQLLPRRLEDFTAEKTTDFKHSLDKSFKFAENFEALAADLVRPTKPSPMDTFLEPSRFRDFGLILEMFDKRKRKVREQLIFANFLKHYPGIEHLGGVPLGGTFILVYEVDSKVVVADFCLPYQVNLDPHLSEPEDLDEPDEPPITTNPIPTKPPLEYLPPYIFNPPPRIRDDLLKIDFLRGDLIQDELIRTRDGLTEKFTSQLADSKMEFGVKINDGFSKVKDDLSQVITTRLQQSKTELNTDFETRLGQASDIFRKEVSSKIDVIQFRGGGAGRLDLEDLVAGGNITVPDDRLNLVRELTDIRNKQAELQAKRSLGLRLNVEEEATLKEVDNRLADLVIEATKQPELTGNTLSASGRTVMETIRSAALSIEGRQQRKRVALRINQIPAATTIGKELRKISAVMNRP